MSKKKPLTEGHVRGVQKGANKPKLPSSLKPTQPPPPANPPPPNAQATKPSAEGE